MKETCCSRRDFIRTTAGTVIVGALSSVPSNAQGGAASSRVAAGDRLVKADDAGMKPLRPEDVAAGVLVMAWPFDAGTQTARSSRLNRLVVVKVDPATLAEPTRRRAADGILAYSAVCTHSGCDVSDWDHKEQALVCPCHASMFDPLDGGEVIDGPAPRPLPLLPLSIADGQLVVAGPFTSAPGFDPA